MKELILLLKESLTFYKETLGNPDPNYRPPTKTIVVVMVTAALLMFAYTYGGVVVKATTTPKPTYTALEKEAVELRIELGRVQRLNTSCVKTREGLEQAYSNLLEGMMTTPETAPLAPFKEESPIASDTFFDRLGELN